MRAKPYPSCMDLCINRRMCHMCFNNPAYENKVKNTKQDPSDPDPVVNYYEED